MSTSTNRSTCVKILVSSAACWNCRIGIWFRPFFTIEAFQIFCGQMHFQSVTKRWPVCLIFFTPCAYARECTTFNKEDVKHYIFALTWNSFRFISSKPSETELRQKESQPTDFTNTLMLYAWEHRYTTTLDQRSTSVKSPHKNVQTFEKEQKEHEEHDQISQSTLSTCSINRHSFVARTTPGLQWRAQEIRRKILELQLGPSLRQASHFQAQLEEKSYGLKKPNGQTPCMALTLGDL